MKAYKLVRKMKDGQLSSLFIGKKARLPIGQWLKSKNIPTKGFKERAGWHCCPCPNAPHLSKEGRVWVEVEIEGITEECRPESQGGLWYLAERMKIIKEV